MVFSKNRVRFHAPWIKWDVTMTLFDSWQNYGFAGITSSWRHIHSAHYGA